MDRGIVTRRGGKICLLAVLAASMVSWGGDQGGDVSTARAELLELKQVDFVVPQVAQVDDLGGDKEFPAGAGLKTDPEMERLLDRAEQFVKDGRLDLATLLWQRILDESGETVMTRDAWTFKTFNHKYRKYAAIAEEIERTLAKLPEEALRIYRLSADGDAQAILAAGQGADREEALGQVVRRYFVSSIGDDAAYELACLRLDRYDFVGASRLLSRILDDYPNPTVDRQDVLLRLALANARVGDQGAASAALAEFEAEGANAASARLLEIVTAEVKQGVDVGATGVEAGDWPMHLGGPTRSGQMPSLPATVTKATLSEAWVADYELPMGQLASNTRQQQLILRGGMAMAKFGSFRNVSSNNNTGPVSREALISKWKSGNWTPAGQLLMAGGHVYYKQNDRVVCRDSSSGKLKWMGRETSYAGDALAQWMVNMRRNYGQSGGGDPAGPLESLLFGDLVNQAMCIHDGILYTVDGPMTDGVGPAVLQPEPQQHFNSQQSPRRARTNFLAAYDARNGKFKWVVGAGGVEGSKFEMGFMAAPVPYAKFLLIPVNDSGAVWMTALDRTTGKQVWKTFLCDDPMGGTNPYSPIGVSVDGGDCYVATGGGVVFALDALSGDVRWAVRYQRSTQGGVTNVGYPYNQLRDIDGWQQDVVIPHGRLLAVLASDSDRLFALDRRSGELVWEAPRQPSPGDDASEYCLGVFGDGLYVAGDRSVRRYNINGGKLIWDTKIEASHGRGVLTSEAVYLPIEETVARFDLATGQQSAKVGVFSPTNEPVGNLFSDGKQLLSVGLARVYALQDLTSRLEILAHRIDNDDPEAHLDRMRLRLRGDQHAEALADLKAAYALLTEQEGGLIANPTLYAGLEELSLVEGQPLTALRLLASADGNLPEADERNQATLESIRSDRNNLIRKSLGEIKSSETKGAATEVLAAAAMVGDRHLLDLARQTMTATATAEDGEKLQAAIKSENAGQRLVAMAGLVPSLGQEQAIEVIGGLLEDESDTVRVQSAIVLANQGDRRSVTTLVELLESDDLQVRAKAVQSLRALTKQRFKYVAYDKPDARQVAVAAWKEWNEKEGAAAELYFPLADSRIMLGRMLVTFYSQGKVVEYDSERKQVWELKVQQPWNAEGLPNGHRLICSYNGKFVAEYDDQGKEIWKMTGLPGYCSNAHRLDNGNTLVTCANANQVLEISPEKKIVWQKTVGRNPQDARRLENGNTLIALQGTHQVIEIDRDGKTVWTVNNMRGPFSASRLPNGNTLIAQSSGGQVVEVDHSGKVIWVKNGLSTPYDAQRLENGNTLIATSQGYREVDPEGKDLWEAKQNGSLRINQY